MDRNLYQRIIDRIAAIALAMVISLGLAGAARADASQWQIKQPHWWDTSAGWQRPGWSGQQMQGQQQWSGQQGQQWQGQQSGQWRHRRHHHFNDGIHQCFGSCFGSRFVFNNGTVFFSTPGVVFGSPGFVIRQPAFIIRQPGFVIGRPAFVAQQPTFLVHRRSPQFIRPDFGQPMRHRHRAGNGMRIITAPGM